MTDSENTQFITHDHLLRFGMVIHIFARLESLMQIAAAGILNTDLGTAMILLNEMPYQKKRKTLRHLNTTIGVDGYISVELMDILDDIHKKTNLRNWIAHATWTKGRKEGAVKPMQMKLGGDAPKLMGHDHNEENYTVDDLDEAVMHLEETWSRFDTFLRSSGLMKRVEDKIEATKSPTAEVPG